MMIIAQILVRSLRIAAAAVVAAVPFTSSADFSGIYGPANWSLSNNNADGQVNTAGAPNSITLTGGDNDSGLPGRTDYLTEAQYSGTVSFFWTFTSSDEEDFDSAGWVKNGVYTDLVGNLPWSGNVTFTVNSGDSFGFSAITQDNTSGRGTLTISQFSAPIPEPGSMTLLLAGFGAFVAWRRKTS